MLIEYNNLESLKNSPKSQYIERKAIKLMVTRRGQC